MTTDVAPPLSRNRASRASDAAAQVKVLPHSIEAEQSVLGGVMLESAAWDRVAEVVNELDFYRPEHRLIFRVCAELAGKDSPLDVVTLAASLKEHGLIEQVGGEAYLFELANNTPSAANITAYAKIVHERSVMRQLISVANEIADSAFHPQGREPHELLDNAERQVFQIAGQGTRDGGPVDISSVLQKAVERIDTLAQMEGDITGLATGYTDFDHMTLGLQPADLVIVAGRPSMGKTTYAMNIAENIAIREGLPVLVFSMEMPAESLAMRMISSLGRIEQQRIRMGNLSDDDWPRVTSAVSMLSESKLFIDDTPALSPTEVRSRARRLAKEHGQLGVIVLDYLQLMRVHGSSENRSTEISEITRSLKALAKELNVPVIVLSQLNRSLEQRTEHRPVMSDLRESGAIEQDADLICMLYRDEVYHKETRDKGIAEVIITKQRNGPIGSVKLRFFGEFSRFDNLDDRHSAT